jgi:hypothetical protein
LSGGKRRGGVGDLREGLTDGIDEEGRPESERGGRLRGYRGGRLVPSGDGAQGGAANRPTRRRGVLGWFRRASAVATDR